MNQTQLQKKKILAEYLNINFESLPFSVQLDWHNDWNSLMKVAIKLKKETNQNYPFTFTENQLSFDKEILFENCFEFVEMINKENNVLCMASSRSTNHRIKN